MAEVRQSQLSLLETLTDCLTNAQSSLAGSEENFIPPADGISLLDVKNDLLLSYLQNLVFLVLLKVRQATDSERRHHDIGKDVKKKLRELQIYIEKGVRPLESKLKYQIESALRAAESSKLAAENKKARAAKSVNGANGAGSESELDDSEDEPLNGAADDDEENAMLLKPNLPVPTKRDKLKTLATKDRDGIYKAPRVNPVAMPDPDRRQGDNEPRKRKSQLLSEYIDEEFSSAPRAQPSIGSNNTILDQGRKGLSQRDRDKEKEKTAYEERNFTRLPAQTKKERRDAKRKGQLDSRDMFGGEDWTGLGGLGDRVSRSVMAGGRSKGSVHDRREKRRATEDSIKNDGMGIGEQFDKRRRIMEGRAQKKAKRSR